MSSSLDFKHFLTATRGKKYILYHNPGKPFMYVYTHLISVIKYLLLYMMHIHIFNYSVLLYLVLFQKNSRPPFITYILQPTYVLQHLD